MPKASFWLKFQEEMTPKENVAGVHFNFPALGFSHTTE